MSIWIAVLICVIANVGANLTFKHAMAKGVVDFTWPAMLNVVYQPGLWLGFMFSAVLLGSYLYTIKHMPVSVAYPSVTGLAALGMLILGSVIAGESITARAAIGVVLIVAGVTLINTV